MKKCILMLIVLSLLFVGCADALPDYELPSKSAEQAESLPATAAEPMEWKEYNTYPVDLDVDRLLGCTDHEIVFLQGKYAQYYDVELGRYFAFCSQPNCVHNDESCPSYFGGDSVTETDYAVAGDSVYAVCVDEAGTLRLRQLKPLTGEKTDLFTDTLPENVHDRNENGTPRDVYWHFENPGLLYTGNALILQYEINRDETLFEDEAQTGHYTAEKVILRYDLKAQKMEELYRDAVPIYGTIHMQADAIADATDRYALFITHGSLREPPMTPEEYYRSVGDEAAYEKYLETHGVEASDYMEYLQALSTSSIPGSAMLWDLETGEKTALCGAQDLHMDSVNALRQHKVCCVKDGQLWRCELRDGSQTKLLDLEGNVQGNIAVIEQWDGRVFFNTWKPIDDESALWTWYWYEPATGELRQLHTGLLPFYIKAETDHFFIGMDQNGTYSVLSKQDFYNGNYAAAQRIGNLTPVD